MHWMFTIVRLLLGLANKLARSANRFVSAGCESDPLWLTPAEVLVAVWTGGRATPTGG